MFGAVIRGNREQGVAGIHSRSEQHEELGHELGVVEQELPLPQSGGVRPVLSLFQEKQQRGDSAEQKKEARFAVFLFAVAERMSLVFPGEGEFRCCSLPAVLCLQIGEKVLGALCRRIRGGRKYREGQQEAEPLARRCIAECHGQCELCGSGQRGVIHIAVAVEQRRVGREIARRKAFFREKGGEVEAAADFRERGVAV